MRIYTLFAFLVLCSALAWGQAAVSVRGVGAAPVSVIADVLGTTPATDATTHEITLTGVGAGTAAPATQVTIIPYVPTLLISGKVSHLFCVPFEWQGETMAPLRALADALGFTINWDGEHAKVTLTNPATKKSRTLPIVDYGNKYEIDLLNVAIATGDLERVKTLIQHDPSIVASKSDKDQPPLADAAVGGKDDIVQYLLDHGAGNATPPSWPLDQPYDPPAAALITAWQNKRASTVDLLAGRTYYVRPNMISNIGINYELAHITACKNDEKQIFYAVTLVYAPGHNGQFPDAATWTQDLQLDDPAHRGSALHCPERPDLAVGYGYNAQLSTSNIKSFADPRHTVFIADCSNSNHLLFSEDDIDWGRHNDGAVVTFADGHTEVLKRDPQHSLSFAGAGWLPPPGLTPGAVIPAPPPTPPVRPPLTTAIQGGKVDDVRALLAAKPDLLTTPLGGDIDVMPFTLACAFGQRDVVALLLKLGAVPNERDAYAAVYIAGAPDIVQMFMKPQAKP